MSDCCYGCWDSPSPCRLSIGGDLGLRDLLWPPLQLYLQRPLQCSFYRTPRAVDRMCVPGGCGLLCGARGGQGQALDHLLCSCLQSAGTQHPGEAWAFSWGGGDVHSMEAFDLVYPHADYLVRVSLAFWNSTSRAQRIIDLVVHLQACALQNLERLSCGASYRLHPCLDHHESVRMVLCA